MKEHRNRFAEFIEQQRREYNRTLEYWAERWTEAKRKLWIKNGYDMSKFTPINPATIARWAKGDRRIGPNHRFIFVDLPFTMDQYYADMPPSDQTQQRSDVRKYGRTRAKAALATDIAAAGVVTVATAEKRPIRTTEETTPATAVAQAV